MRFGILFSFVALIFVINAPELALSQDKIHTGAIKGNVIDAETKVPLIGVNVVVVGTEKGAATDSGGAFIIKKLPVGSYILQFDYIGYEQLKKTDIIVRSGRSTVVYAELKMTALDGKEVVVTSNYFSKVEDEPTSVVSFSYEEIRRAPGSAGDVSRIIMGLPSIAKVNDQTNNLVVRGGSPVENGFFVDNIEIPNINHWPAQGTSGGAIGLLNVDFIRDVSFYSGGFSPKYGDKLSAIMDLDLREGNRSEFDGQLDLNFSGFGGVAEGPLFNKKGSFLVSVRRSYLDFLVDAIDIGTSVAPRYGDMQGKLVYDINQNHKIMLVSVSGDDHNNPDRKAAEENDMIVYGNQDIYQNTTGINWRAIWNKKGYSNTSFAYTSLKYREDFFETNTALHLIKNRSLEQTVKFRNVNHFRLDKKNSIEFGIETKRIGQDYNNFYSQYTDALGDATQAFNFNKKINATTFAAFLNYKLKPFAKLASTWGLRFDHFSYNNKSSISPRFSFSYDLTSLTSISGSAGLFYQNIPLILLSQNESNKSLKIPMATHYILGIEHLISANTKFTLEFYQKNYSHFPLDPGQPQLFLFDEIVYRYGFFFNHEKLVDSGKAYSRGVEITLQKKLKQNFYGLLGASYFRAKYKGSDYNWKNRVYDNRLIFSMQGGYKLNNKWEFSLRWIFAGGTPYTPFDLEKSKGLKRSVLDENRINDARYPDYHSLNIRFDRRFNFKASNLIFYFSVWNVYNRKNVAGFFWSEKENKQKAIYQWPALPIFGLEYEF